MRGSLLDFLTLSRWDIYHGQIVLSERLWPELFLGKLDHLLRYCLAFLFHECFVPQVKCHVVNPVKRLLRSFSFPNIWDEVTNDVLHSFLSHFSLTLQLLSQSLLNLPELHLIVVIPLLEGRRRIGIVRVRVLPELSGEGDSLLAVSALSPVWYKNSTDESSIELIFEIVFANSKEIFNQTFLSLILSFEHNLLHDIDKALEIILSYRLLWHCHRHLAWLGRGNRYLAVLDLGVDSLEESTLITSNLEISFSPIEV